MPTGYTSKIYDGENVTGKEFLLDCARAFGACIEMRDDPLTKEIPDEFKPSTYHEEQLKNYLIKLEEYKNTSIEDAEILSMKDYDEAERYRLNAIDKDNKLRLRYQKALDEVQKWNPPTKEHEGLKKFAIEQLTESINFDCSGSYYTPIKKLTGQEWLDKKIEECNWNIEYCKKEQKEENERVADRNEWIKQLRESLT
jgi:hypothetical protein